ncbi:hypothetical protein BC939DRAFT_472453 [Gamsiella multidivaricata]|uniref:uncharacterized protein n=1 Tax=Gamsiella multidivaricata TaxID=101098 RepID=UPI00221E682A|nr:uncharacterized protein BC939DRAFT_472453 [Gamsiella multidivaricata]KAI7832198.1 hypothetical protein BC939DRAFT_472453 [Gamsiella multidivaricata]
MALKQWYPKLRLGLSLRAWSSKVRTFGHELEEEASLTTETIKDAVNLHRLSVWTKQLQGQLSRTYQGSEEELVSTLQVMKKAYNVYEMGPVGYNYIWMGVQLGHSDVPRSIPAFFQTQYFEQRFAIFRKKDGAIDSPP